MARETMKIVSLVGSPNGRKGNTGRLLQLVLDAAEKEGAVCETISLKGNSVGFCRGCDSCHVKGTCPQDDDFEEIKQKIFEADGLVLASPNYIFSVSAQLKAFMDRCCGVIHCMSFSGKYGASIITSGGGDEPPIAEYMHNFLITTGIRPVGAVWATMGHIPGDDFPQDIKDNAEKLGRLLVTAWQEKMVFPNIEQRMVAFQARMETLMSYNQEKWPYEAECWENKNSG